VGRLPTIIHRHPQPRNLLLGPKVPLYVSVSVNRLAEPSLDPSSVDVVVRPRRGDPEEEDGFFLLIPLGALPCSFPLSRLARPPVHPTSVPRVGPQPQHPVLPFRRHPAWPASLRY